MQNAGLTQGLAAYHEDAYCSVTQGDHLQERVSDLLYIFNKLYSSVEKVL